MGPFQNILLLAGSAEAREIAVALQSRGLAVRALMSEPPRGANPMPMDFEVVEDLTRETLAAAMAGRDAVIDASHGFDARLTNLGFAAATAEQLPFLTLSRPVWEVSEHHLWRSAANVACAMPMIGPGARVFAATGWDSLRECAAFPGACLMLRQTSPHSRSAEFDFVDLVFGDPPFTADSEAALFKERGVDVLICRNLGGLPSRPKLEAAKLLDIEVILIDRPPLPEAALKVSNVAEVLAWVDGRCA